MKFTLASANTHIFTIIFKPAYLKLFKPSWLLDKWIIAWLLVGGLQLSGYGQQYWQQQVNVNIDVTLNDVEHTLDAFEKIGYTNNSPDTLRYIWFHLWPNAYRNDHTAFSEQLLLNNRTDFYFAPQQQRGYINRLNFQVNGRIAATEDHPQYIDVVKLILPQPLLPAQVITITTPFHVQLPGNFSRGGHTKQSYQITQWYPKPAVYDRKGWHEMPYLDQGEFYNEFGNYTVSITVPANYVVAATGQLQDSIELEWIKKRADFKTVVPSAKKPAVKGKTVAVKPDPPAGTTDRIVSSADTKTLRYLQNNVHDFAWFADKRFIVQVDTLRLPSGKMIDVFSYFLPSGAATWKNSIRFIKDAVLTRSAWLGEYPYQTVSAVEALTGTAGGMEYPTITCISPVKSEKDLDLTIAHEVGHNWLHGILATNERRFPWMDEGMNTFYDSRYKTIKYPADRIKPMDAFLARRLPDHPEELLLQTVAGIRKDQPISSSSEEFSKENYGLVAYYKAGQWMKKLEQQTGQKGFDSCMQAYYRRWQFRHPYPDDFRAVFEQGSGTKFNTLFHALDTTGSLETEQAHRVTRLTALFNLRQTDHINYIAIAPSAGFNLYDGPMLGALVHNIQLPLRPFGFFAAPMFALRSKKLNGIARVSYTWYPGRQMQKVSVGAATSVFSIGEFKPENQDKLFLGVRKIAPYIRFTFRETALSKRERYIQFRSFFIHEDALQFRQLISGADTSDVVTTTSDNFLINQLKLGVSNYRVLYPYSGGLQIEQHPDFVRAAFTAKYFLNYPDKGGVNIRLFAGKFFYTGGRTVSKQFATDRYHLNLTGADGREDYTYSDYFIGRNKFEGFASQQIMMRDGGFKVRTDLLSSKVGKTDNWLAALNLSAHIPDRINPLQVLPVHLPLKVFADAGTYAEAWTRDANTNRFLFDAGFQLSFLQETVNIYIPVVYSAVYRNYYKSTLGSKRFWKVISFSIDVQNFTLRKLHPAIPL